MISISASTMSSVNLSWYCMRKSCIFTFIDTRNSTWTQFLFLLLTVYVKPVRAILNFYWHVLHRLFIRRRWNNLVHSDRLLAFFATRIILWWWFAYKLSTNQFEPFLIILQIFYSWRRLIRICNCIWVCVLLNHIVCFLRKTSILLNVWTCIRPLFLSNFVYNGSYLLRFPTVKMFHV